MRSLVLSVCAVLAFLTSLGVKAQNVQEKPAIIYGQTRQIEIGGITVEGVKNYEDYVLIGISGLSVGQYITLPGDEISDAVKRYWKHGLFSSVRIEADSIVDNKVYLKMCLHSVLELPLSISKV